MGLCYSMKHRVHQSITSTASQTHRIRLWPAGGGGGENITDTHTSPPTGRPQPKKKHVNAVFWCPRGRGLPVPAPRCKLSQQREVCVATTAGPTVLQWNVNRNMEISLKFDQHSKSGRTEDISFCFWSCCCGNGGNMYKMENSKLLGGIFQKHLSSSFTRTKSHTNRKPHFSKRTSPSVPPPASIFDHCLGRKLLRPLPRGSASSPTGSAEGPLPERTSS